MTFGPDGGFGDGVSGDMGGLGDILPAMQGMLQSLLSKELLYPSIKEIVNKVGMHRRRVHCINPAYMLLFFFLVPRLACRQQTETRNFTV